MSSDPLAPGSQGSERSQGPPRERGESPAAERDKLLQWLVIAGRFWAVAAVVTLVALIMVPWHVSPVAARRVGLCALALVSIGVIATVTTFRALAKMSAGFPAAFDDVAERSEQLRVQIAAGQAVPSDGLLATFRSREPAQAQIATFAARAVGVRIILSPNLPLDADAERQLRIAASRWRAPGAALRAVGPAWLAVGFITGWTGVSLLVWAGDPAPCPQAGSCSGAFAGLPAEPRVGEFVYFTVNAMVVNVLPDVTAVSPAARALFVAIMLSGVAILGRYATALWAEARELSLAEAHRRGSGS